MPLLGHTSGLGYTIVREGSRLSFLGKEDMCGFNSWGMNLK